MESSASGSSRRSRAPGGSGTQFPSCLVDGCAADLGKCRDYHRRHKVCELHSKTPRVSIQGQEQRFCQQCSRFHSLEEFDEGKRSCRTKLDVHNRRRRKPQPDSLSINPVRFLSNIQGTKFMPFSSPELLCTSAAPPVWTGIARGKTDLMLQNSQSQLDFSNGGSSSHNYKEGKQFPFLGGGASSVCQPLVTGLNRVFDSSNCALSLLSSSPQPQTRGFGLDHMVQTHSNSVPIPIPIPPTPGQSMMRNLKATDGEPSRNAPFEMGHDTTGSGTHHQMLSFTWE